MRAYRRAAGATMFRDDGLYVEPPEGGPAFRIEGEGRRLWEWLEYPATVGDLCRRSLAEFEAEAGAMSREIATFLEKLEARGLVEALPAPPSPAETARHRYLWLLKRALVNLIYPEHELRLEFLEEAPRDMEKPDRERFLRDIGRRRADELEALRTAKMDGRVRRGVPARYSHTMIGLLRLDNIERSAETVFREGVAGDFFEAGVCQGGAAVFMRVLQVAHGEADRATWAADSFRGLPDPSGEVDSAAGLDLTESRFPWLAWDKEAVADHFRRYDLLDDQVRFLEGWFHDTLPRAPVDRIAVLRIDADLYQSTREVLETLYDRVSPGGFVIVDDYGVLGPCRKAVDEFRLSRGFQAPLRRIDDSGVFWKKPA